MRKTTRWVAGGLLVAGIALPAMAQGPQRGGRGGARGERGQRDPEQMRAMMEKRLQETLGASDEEWTALGPLVTDVMEKQRATNMRGGRRGRPGAPPRDGGRAEGGRRGEGRPEGGPDDSSQTAVAALRTVLDNESATAEQITAQLTAVRAERTKAKTELAAAQAKLKEVLTVKQEARLVLMGLLD